MREPRSRTIANLVRQALRHSGLTEMAYADAVVEHYHRSVALHERTIEFHTGASVDALEAAQRANRQLVRRMLDDTVRLAADIEESLVSALPAPWRDRLLSDLSGRYGLLAARLPATDGASGVAHLGELSREFGEALLALSKTLGDGKLDPTDAPQARKVIAELDDLIAQAMSLRAAHAALLGSAAA